MFSLEDFDLQFDTDNEPALEKVPVRTPANVFREPSNTTHSAERPKTKAVCRKFPGPAGLLPDKPPQSFNDSSLVLEHLENDVDQRRDKPMLCSQASESIFLEPQFKKLTRDFGLDAVDSPLSAFTVDWVKKKALGKGLKSRKIPFLAVILQSVDCGSGEALLTLRDHTGEVVGVLDQEAWKEMNHQFEPGVAIVLKEVGVLSTGVTRQVILNMTKNNILSIYSSTDEGEVLTDTVQPTTKAEILQNVAEWQARPVNYPSPKPPPTIRNNLFVQHTTDKGIIHQNKSKPFRPHFLQNVQTESNFELFSDDLDFTNIDEGYHQATKKPKPDVNIDTQTVLSQAETSMLDEVLSGVDLDDF